MTWSEAMHSATTTQDCFVQECSDRECNGVQVLGLLHAVHSAAVMCQLLSPALYNPIAGKHGMTSICLLNSFNLAIACRCAVDVPCMHASSGPPHAAYKRLAAAAFSCSN